MDTHSPGGSSDLLVDHLRQVGARPTAISHVRRFAWLAILIVDAGFVLWGAMAALWPEHLLGPHSAPIVTAGYEGFTRGSWSELLQTSPGTAGYIMLLFRTYGAYNVAFALPAIALTVGAFRRGDRWAWWGLLLGNTIALGSAMTYDRLAHAIGPFEVTEYVGLALVYVALAVTLPLLAARRQSRSLTKAPLA